MSAQSTSPLLRAPSKKAVSQAVSQIESRISRASSTILPIPANHKDLPHYAHYRASVDLTEALATGSGYSSHNSISGSPDHQLSPNTRPTSPHNRQIELLKEENSQLRDSLQHTRSVLEQIQSRDAEVQIRALEEQIASLKAQNEKLQQERDDAVSRLSQLISRDSSTPPISQDTSVNEQNIAQNNTTHKPILTPTDTSQTSLPNQELVNDTSTTLNNDSPSNSKPRDQDSTDTSESPMVTASTSSVSKSPKPKDKKPRNGASSQIEGTYDEKDGNQTDSGISYESSESRMIPISPSKKVKRQARIDDDNIEPSSEVESTKPKRSTFKRTGKTESSTPILMSSTDAVLEASGRPRTASHDMTVSDTEGLSSSTNPRMPFWDVKSKKSKKRNGMDIISSSADTIGPTGIGHRTSSAQYLTGNRSNGFSGGDYSSVGSSQSTVSDQKSKRSKAGKDLKKSTSSNSVGGSESSTTSQSLNTSGALPAKSESASQPVLSVTTAPTTSILSSSTSSPKRSKHQIPRDDIATDVEMTGRRSRKNVDMSIVDPGSMRPSKKVRTSVEMDEKTGYGEYSPSRLKPVSRESTLRKKKSIKDKAFGIAFGVRRGACDAPCPCTVYQKMEESFACVNCNHFPAQHTDLGRVSEDEEERDSGEENTNNPDSASQGEISERGPEHHMREPPPEVILDTASSLSSLWVLDFSDCYFTSQLGKGNSSTVFLGQFKNTQVAIKVLRAENHKRDLEDFKKEMEIMSSLRSPYIVHFYGATLTPKICIILEYCSKGTLFHYLHDDHNYVDWRLALRWLTESVRGINTLHLWKPQIVHRDLKTLNLLLDEQLKIKVCDFGLSRFVSGDHDQSTFFKMRGTYAYFAPEVYLGKPFTAKSDVYSIGIILWEIVHRVILGSHTRPFAEYKHIIHDFQIIIQASKGLRPTLPLSTPRVLVKLYEDCVCPEPDQRPTCQDILARLEEISEYYEAHTDSWDPLVRGGVRTRAPVVRRDSAVHNRSPNRNSPARAELTRSSVGTRTLKEDLTRRGVSPALLKKEGRTGSLFSSTNDVVLAVSSDSTSMVSSGQSTSNPKAQDEESQPEIPPIDPPKIIDMTRSLTDSSSSSHQPPTQRSSSSSSMTH